MKQKSSLNKGKKDIRQSSISRIEKLTTNNFLFRGINLNELEKYLATAGEDSFSEEKLYANRPIYTAYLPDKFLSHLYVLIEGGPVITRSTPLDRVIALTYPGSCFGLLSLDILNTGNTRGFPSSVEAYKTTDTIKIPRAVIRSIYTENADFRDRYRLMLEIREKFQYHLLNCSTYPPQAVAALLRALVYQERTLGNRPRIVENKTENAIFCFDLPVDIIAKACQLNHRTVEQVLKGMIKANLLESNDKSENNNDLVRVIDPEGLKAVYGATRDKVSWWPLR